MDAHPALAYRRDVRPTEIRRRLTRYLRRHRRPVAAALAGTGVLLAVSTLRPAPVVLVDPGPSPSSLRTGEVAVPVALASAAIARTLSTGDVIDVVGISGTESGVTGAAIVAASTRVIEVDDSGAGFGSSASAVVLLAVREADALDLTAISAQGPVSILIRDRSTAG